MWRRTATAITATALAATAFTQPAHATNPATTPGSAQPATAAGLTQPAAARPARPATATGSTQPITATGSAQPATAAGSTRPATAAGFARPITAAGFARSAARDVTLPTGDQVHVSADNAVTVTPKPRPGGYRPAFSVTQDGSELSVAPDDGKAQYDVVKGPARAAPSGGLVTIHVKGIARDGRPGRGEFNMLNVQDGTRGNSRRLIPGDASMPCTDARWDQSGCIQVPPGTYSVLGVIDTMPSWAPSTGEGRPLNKSFVGYPELKITGDTEITLDARKATEVKVTTPGHPTKRNLGAFSQLMWARTPAKGDAVHQGFNISPGSQLEERVFLQPTERVRTGRFEVFTRWRLEAPAITMSARGVRLDPEYYDPANFSDISAEYPRLNGTARLRVAGPGQDPRGKLALIQRSDAVPVAEQSNRAAAAGARFVAIYNDKPGLNTDTGGNGVKLAVPTVRLSYEQGHALLARRHATVTAKGIVRSPYLYELVYPEQGRVPHDLRYVARTRDLARVDNTFNGDNVTMSAGRHARRPGQTFTIATTYPLFGTARARTDYLSADPDTLWTGYVSTPESYYNNQFPHPKRAAVTYNDAGQRAYRPGEHQRASWNKAPLTAGVNAAAPISRTGDGLSVRIGLVDAARDFSAVYTSDFPGGYATDFRMYQGDTLIARTPNLPFGTIAMTPDQAAYRMEFDIDDNATGTRSRSAWTFHSAHTDSTTTVPLLLVDYDAGLDLHNRARSHTLNLAVRHQGGAPGVRVKKITVAASTDDGATWTDLRITRTRTGYAVHPRGKGAVSLKINVEDDDGNTLSQQIIRAY